MLGIGIYATFPATSTAGSIPDCENYNIICPEWYVCGDYGEGSCAIDEIEATVHGGEQILPLYCSHCIVGTVCVLECLPV